MDYDDSEQKYTVTESSKQNWQEKIAQVLRAMVSLRINLEDKSILITI